MADNNNSVPYIVYEGTLDRLGRQHRWHMIIILVLIVLLAVTNLAWLYAWNLYDYVDKTQDYSVDIDAGDGGNANYIGNDGDINNGKDNSSQGNEDKEQSAA